MRCCDATWNWESGRCLNFALMSLRQPITFTCWCLRTGRDWLCVPSCCMTQFIFVCLWWKTAKSVHGISWLSRKSAMLFSMLAYKVCAQAFLSAVLAAGIVDSTWKDMPSRWRWNAQWSGMVWRNVQRAQSQSHCVRLTYMRKDCTVSVTTVVLVTVTVL